MIGSYSFARKNLSKLFKTGLLMVDFIPDSANGVEWMDLGCIWIAACISLLGFTFESQRLFLVSWERSLHSKTEREIVEIIEKSALVASDYVKDCWASNKFFSLRWACMNGCTSLISAIISSDCSQNLTPSVVSECALIASSCGHFQAVDVTLSFAESRGWNINLEEALYQACDGDYSDIAKRILIYVEKYYQANRSLVRKPTAFFNNCFKTICSHGNIALCRLLLYSPLAARGNPFRIWDLDPSVGIGPCLQNGQAEVLQLILHYSPSLSSRVTLSAVTSSKVAHKAMFKYVTSESGIRFCSRDVFQALLQCSRNGHLSFIKEILFPPFTSRIESPVDSNEDFFPVLVSAVENNRPDVVRYLLEMKLADPTLDDNYVLRYAAGEGFSQVVETLLLEEGEVIDASVRNNVAIRLACARGHANVVRLLLRDASVDPGVDENVCLRDAAENGHADVVRLLLECEAHAVDPRIGGDTALRLAVINKHMDVVREFVQDGRLIGSF